MLKFVIGVKTNMKARKFEIRIVWWEEDEHNAVIKGHPDLYQFSSSIVNAIFAELTKKGITDSIVETVVFCEKCRTPMRSGEINLEKDLALCEGCE